MQPPLCETDRGGTRQRATAGEAGDLAWRPLLRLAARAMPLDLLPAFPVPVATLIATAPPPREGEPYGRRALFRDGGAEVLLVRWREDAFSAPHDHGEASGFVYLLRGAFVERTWEFHRGRLVVTGWRRTQAPGILRVGAGAIHDVKATGGGVSLHVYVPAISHMRVFDRARRETLSVSDACGAWIPHDPALITGRVSW